MPAPRLTPEHLAALLDDPWDGTGPLRIATDLSPEEVEPFFGAHNAALLLQVLLEEGSARLTAEGDLPRRLVLELMRRLRWDAGHLESLREGHGWAPLPPGSAGAADAVVALRGDLLRSRSHARRALRRGDGGARTAAVSPQPSAVGHQPSAVSRGTKRSRANAGSARVHSQWSRSHLKASRLSPKAKSATSCTAPQRLRYSARRA
jgi:hypothetical protein